MRTSELTGAPLDFRTAESERGNARSERFLPAQTTGQHASQVWVEPTDTMRGHNVDDYPSSH
jgi:hypothetical protein